MCYTKIKGQWVFGTATFPSYFCQVCGGDLRNPPPRREMAVGMDKSGQVDDPDAY